MSSSLTCLQLHKRAERVAALLMERGGLQEGDHVALVYPPGWEMKHAPASASVEVMIPRRKRLLCCRYRPDRGVLRQPVRRLRSHHGATAPPSEHLHHPSHCEDDRGGQTLLLPSLPRQVGVALPPASCLQVSHSACVMTTAVICKLLRSKEATATVDIRNWPPVLDTGKAPRPPLR